MCQEAISKMQQRQEDLKQTLTLLQMWGQKAEFEKTESLEGLRLISERKESCRGRCLDIYITVLMSPQQSSSLCVVGTSSQKWTRTASELFIKKKCCLRVLSPAWLLGTLRTVACQTPLSVGLSGRKHWSGLPFSPPEDPPDPGVEPMPPASPALQAGSLPLSHRERCNKNSFQSLHKASNQKNSLLQIHTLIWNAKHQYTWEEK